MFAIDLAFFSSDFSVYRMMLLASMGVELLLFPLILMLRRGAEMTENGMVITKEEVKHPGLGFVEASWLTVKEAADQTLSLFGGLVRTPGFHRLIIFLLLIGFLKVVFNVMDYVLPPFAIKELGSMETVGRLNAINGVLILVLAPAIGIMTQKYSAYAMVILGGLVTAGSFVFMVLPTSAFQGMADGWVGDVIGHHYLKLVGAVSPWYVMIAFWQIMFSVGEAFYSPRVYEYASSIAPKGQEASYASLSYIPLLIGKLITALLGFLGVMAWMCPEEGPGNPQLAWLMIGLMVLVAPLGLLFFKRYIRVKEEGRAA
jgi:MFS family permease